MTVKQINVSTGEETEREMTQEEVNSLKEKYSKEKLKQYRDEVWSSAVITLDNGAEIANNMESRAKIGLAFNESTAKNVDGFTKRWKCLNGWHDLTPKHFQDFFIDSGHIEQKSYDAEAHVLSNEPYESWEEAKQEFDTFMEG